MVKGKNQGWKNRGLRMGGGVQRSNEDRKEQECQHLEEGSSVCRTSSMRSELRLEPGQGQDFAVSAVIARKLIHNQGP